MNSRLSDGFTILVVGLIVFSAILSPMVGVASAGQPASYAADSPAVDPCDTKDDDEDSNKNGKKGKKKKGNRGKKGGGGGFPGGDDCNRQSVSFSDVNSSLSALELRVQAWQRLATAADTNGDGEPELTAENRTALRDRLNESFTYYQGFNRTNASALFEADKEVAEETGRRRPNVTARLIESDGQLARTAIADAKRVRATLEARGVSLDSDTIEEHLRKAEKAMDQAAHVREKSPNPVAAITHYKRAWEHAQRVLDIMDAAVAPEVSIVRRADPRHNGSYNYTVVAEVFAVRPAALDNATVTINGESQTVPVRVRNVTPGSTATVVARVTLEDRVNTLTLTVSDSGETLSEHSDGFEPNADSATLELDADGLSDVYERENTSTDPLDPDSDATATAIDEADNGTDDGMEDFDNDGLGTLAERSLGTDPLDNDTDGDNVSDFYEVLLTKTDPLDPDTDGDGTSDGMEDFDGDGLTNAREEVERTHPNRSDTDGDTLSDSVEVNGETNPLLSDTDQDGLGDEVEPTDPFHTDPTDPDTDDDGILDGNETYRDSVVNESVNTTVQVVGKGDVGGQTEVMDEQQAGFDNDLLGNARSSPVVEVRSEADLETALVRMHYDDAGIENEKSLRVYRFNQSGQYFESLRTKVYPEQDLAVAQTREVGLFVVMSPARYAGMFRSPDEINESTINKTTFEDPGSKCSGLCSSDGDSIAVGLTEDGPVGSSGGNALGIQSTEAENNSSRVLWESNTTYTVVSDGNTTTVYKGKNKTSSSNDSSSKASMSGGFSTTADDGSRFVTMGSGQTSGGIWWETLYPLTIPDAPKVIYKGIVRATAKQDTTVKLRLSGSSKNTVYSFSCTAQCPDSEQTTFRDDVTWLAGEEVDLQVGINGTGSLTLLKSALVYEKDSDGDGIGDEIDLCKNTKGSQATDGCPFESSVPVLSFNLSEEIANMSIDANIASDLSDSASSAELLVEVWHTNGSKDVRVIYEDLDAGETQEYVQSNFQNLTSVDNVTLRLRTRGYAMVSTSDLDVRLDTDGDGLWNAKELQGFNTTRWGHVTTDAYSADTDDDNLSDGIEVGESVPFFTANEDGERVARTTYKTVAHPGLEYSDLDTLNDSQEYYGWPVSVVNRSGSPYRWNATGEKESGETFGTVHFESDPAAADTDGDGLRDDIERNKTHTNPNATVTYGITEKHEEDLYRSYYQTWEDAKAGKQKAIEQLIYVVGLTDDPAPQQLSSTELTDATDDFDFVRADDGSLAFTALDGKERTDVWMTNEEEVWNSFTDPWDPDTDDDGLTDGQEHAYITLVKHDHGGIPHADVDTATTANTSPLAADHDNDGWWDGWIGVYDVGRSDNVILYQEHLRDEDMGIQPYELVQAQVGVHNESEAPMARGADIDNDQEKEHSNVHLGELYWGTNPDRRSDDPMAQTHLRVELDYVENASWPGDGDPSDFTNSNGVDMLTAVSKNYRLYGIKIEFGSSNEEIQRADLRSICKGSKSGGVVWKVCDVPAATKLYITPDNGFNRYELGRIEKHYHDDDSKLHMLWGTTLAHDTPETTIDTGGRINGLDYSDSTGLAQHVGSPKSYKVNYVEPKDFGVMIARDRFEPTGGDFRRLQSTTMHELGHALSIGWADDAGIPYVDFAAPHGYEVYSGSEKNDLAGGVDPTPERIVVGGNTDTRWSIMKSGYGEDTRTFTGTSGKFPVLVFSLEELSTIDFYRVPSKEDS